MIVCDPERTPNGVEYGVEDSRHKVLVKFAPPGIDPPLVFYI